MEVWSGFKTAVGIYEGNQVKLLIDFTSRILRKDNMLEHLIHLRKDLRKNRAFIERKVKGCSVMASYGNYRIYRVQEIDFKKSPLSTMETPKGEKMTFV